MWSLINPFRYKSTTVFEDAAEGLVCCAALGGTLYFFRKHIPHPTEFPPIGWLALRFGCHNHEKFNLLLDIHECTDLPQSGKYLIKLTCGRSEAQTKTAVTKDLQDSWISRSATDSSETCTFSQKVLVHVRQRDEFLLLELVNSGRISSSLIGTCKIRIGDLIDARFPKKVTYSFQKEYRNVAKVSVSFYKLSPNMVIEKTTPLLFQAMINTQTDADIKGHSISIDFANMSEKDQLTFFSKILQGNLYCFESEGIDKAQMYYFRAVESLPNRWEWDYWISEGEYLKGGSKLGGYLFLAISIVLPDKSDRNKFYIKYHDLSGAHDLFFRTVDRDRDIWSEGLYEFIDRLRSYLNHTKEDSALFNLDIQNTSFAEDEKPSVYKDPSKVNLENEAICLANDQANENPHKDLRSPTRARGRTIKPTLQKVPYDSYISKQNPTPSSIKRMMREVSPPRKELDEVQPLLSSNKF
ncbi:hypothetical protein ACR3K2_03560 [Cryptosporidium serpentis]